MPPELRSQADQGLTPWGFLTLWQEDDFAWKDAINSAEDLATGVAAILFPPDDAESQDFAALCATAIAGPFRKFLPFNQGAFPHRVRAELAAVQFDDLFAEFANVEGPPWGGPATPALVSDALATALDIIQGQPPQPAPAPQPTQPASPPLMHAHQHPPPLQAPMPQMAAPSTPPMATQAFLRPPTTSDLRALATASAPTGNPFTLADNNIAARVFAEFCVGVQMPPANIAENHYALVTKLLLMETAGSPALQQRVLQVADTVELALLQMPPGASAGDVRFKLHDILHKQAAAGKIDLSQRADTTWLVIQFFQSMSISAQRQQPAAPRDRAAKPTRPDWKQTAIGARIMAMKPEVDPKYKFPKAPGAPNELCYAYNRLSYDPCKGKCSRKHECAICASQGSAGQRHQPFSPACPLAHATSPPSLLHFRMKMLALGHVTPGDGTT